MENHPGRYRPENQHPKPTEQPSQPEQTQPQQGRAEGKQNLQGPTTVDRSEQPTPQQKGDRDNSGKAVFNCVVPKFGPDSLMNRVVKVGERLDDVQWRLGKTELIHEPPPITAEEMRRLEKQERRLQNEYLSLRKKISEFQHKQLKELRDKDLQ